VFPYTQVGAKETLKVIAIAHLDGDGLKTQPVIPPPFEPGAIDSPWSRRPAASGRRHPIGAAA
jgi:hypothetical protein